MDSKKTLNLYGSEFLSRLIRSGATSANFALFKNQQLSFFKSSDEKWQEYYLNSDEGKNCHIKLHGVNMLKRNVGSFTTLWNSLTPHNDQARILEESRIKHNHCNGVSMCQKIFDDTLLCIALTGDRNNDNFTDLVIKNKKSLLLEATDIITLMDLLDNSEEILI